MFLLPTSYWFTALGYFNIILPSIPAEAERPGRMFLAPALAQLGLRPSSVRTLRFSFPNHSSCPLGGRPGPRAKVNPPPYPEIIPSRAPSKALCGISLFRKLGQAYSTTSARRASSSTVSRQRVGCFQRDSCSWRIPSVVSPGMGPERLRGRDRGTVLGGPTRDAWQRLHGRPSGVV